MHAIIIEDEPALQLFYKFVLEKTGFTITTVLDGETALNLLHDVPAPAVIILDMFLPSINGESVLDYIQQHDRFKDTLILIISAHEHFSALAEGDSRIKFLLKPVRPAEIMALIEAAMPINS